uniref:Uncharacterized protein n=1 Tax=Leptospira santarosai serovar Arenal str. MAVJ 401 TaxID=1049976 RepID=M6JNJ6_9LEPT|nr:hypothetical protein LEP1GSC063_1124 [Leptospira santarosai serovar Arenal str. MAVJ 401]
MILKLFFYMNTDQTYLDLKSALEDPNVVRAVALDSFDLKSFTEAIVKLRNLKELN